MRKLFVLAVLALILAGCIENGPVKKEEKNPVDVYETSNKKYKDLDDYSLEYAIGIDKEGDFLTNVLIGVLGEIRIEVAEKGDNEKVRLSMLSSNGTFYVENGRKVTCIESGLLGLNISSCKKGEEIETEETNADIIEPENFTDSINYTFEYLGETEYLGRKCDYVVMEMKPEVLKKSEYRNASRLIKEACYDREYGFPHYLKVRKEDIKDEQGTHTLNVFAEIKGFRKGISYEEVNIPFDSTVEMVDCDRNGKVTVEIVPFSEEVKAHLSITKEEYKIGEEKVFTGLEPWEENIIVFDIGENIKSRSEAKVCIGKVCETDSCSGYSIYD